MKFTNTQSLTTDLTESEIRAIICDYFQKLPEAMGGPKSVVDLRLDFLCADHGEKHELNARVEFSITSQSTPDYLIDGTIKPEIAEKPKGRKNA